MLLLVALFLRNCLGAQWLLPWGIISEDAMFAADLSPPGEAGESYTKGMCPNMVLSKVEDDGAGRPL